MFMRLALSILASVVLVTESGAAGAQEAGEDGKDGRARPAVPLDVGSRWQLFIDKLLVQSAEGATFTLHPAMKHPAGPWLAHRGEGPAGTMVIYDEEEKIFKSWSRSSFNTSRDGFQWTRKEKNPDSWEGISSFVVIKDVRDPDPARRYKIISYGPSGEGTANNTEKWPYNFGMDRDGSTNVVPDRVPKVEGYNTYVSPDGRHLTHLSFKPIMIGGGEMITGYYDKRLGVFVAFPKTENPDAPQRGYPRLDMWDYSVMTSRDFQTWTTPRQAFLPDRLDTAVSLERFNAARPMMIQSGEWDSSASKPNIFAVDGCYSQESCAIVFPRIIFGNADGPSEFQLAVSRDLLHWERPFRVPAVPRGRIGDKIEHSEWDSCWFDSMGPLMDVGDEVWAYYSARNTSYRSPMYSGGVPAGIQARLEHLKGKVYFSGIGLAIWRRDRFVSVDSPAPGGTLTTVPVVFTGDCLELNALAKEDGQIAVNLVDKDGKVLGRSVPFRGDDLRHVVKWENGLNLAGLAGRPVSLRFKMKNAELYAFAFRKGPPQAKAAAPGLAKATKPTVYVPEETVDHFGSGENRFSIVFVTIGNPENRPDITRFPKREAGAVPYVYRIAKYEITGEQVTKATVLGKLRIAKPANPKWRPTQPSPFLGHIERMRFVNWLNTSTGHHPAYKFDENGDWDLWSRDEAWQEGGENLYRHKDAFYFLVSNDEYHKAAYYDPLKDVYYRYPYRSNSPPMPVPSGTAAGTCVYRQPLTQGPADVDNAGGLSPYGVMALGGNVPENLETAYDGRNDSLLKPLHRRGGWWFRTESIMDAAHGTDCSWSYAPARHDGNGFRVAARARE